MTLFNDIVLKTFRTVIEYLVTDFSSSLKII